MTQQGKVATGLAPPSVRIAGGARGAGRLARPAACVCAAGRRADVRGLFVGPCLRAVGDIGLRMETVRLTEFPMPVEGLVVGQSPAPGTKVRRWTCPCAS